MPPTDFKKAKQSKNFVGVASPLPKIPNFLMKLFGKIPRVSGNLKPEDKICIEFAGRCIRWTLAGDLKTIWFHVTNEYSGEFKPIWGAIRSAMGRIAGTPDYVFLGKASFMIEFKAPGKPQTPHQKAFEQWCGSVGIAYHLAYSADQGEEILRGHGVL